MARKKATPVVDEQETLYRVTSKDHNAVFLKGKIIAFDDNCQAVVTKKEFETLKEMGVIM